MSGSWILDAFPNPQSVGKTGLPSLLLELLSEACHLPALVSSRPSFFQRRLGTARNMRQADVLKGMKTSRKKRSRLLLVAKASIFSK